MSVETKNVVFVSSLVELGVEGKSVTRIKFYMFWRIIISKNACQVSSGNKCTTDYFLMSQIPGLPQKVVICPGLKETQASVLGQGVLFCFLVLVPHALL